MALLEPSLQMASIFLLQDPSTHETRSVRMASMLLDGYQVLNATFDRIQQHAEGLSNGLIMPVGSVEFVREAMRIAGVEEPSVNPYPESLRPWFKRRIQQRKAGEILDVAFVKPVTTKLFNGFVFDPLGKPELLDEHDQEQHAVFTSLNADAIVWVAEPVKFVSEWRYYVDKGIVIGRARYDDGEENALEPDLIEVLKAAQAAHQELKHGFALDMGVLDNGETVLCEINDAWAIGLYANSLSPTDYTLWLSQRWSGIVPSDAMHTPKNGSSSAFGQSNNFR